MPFRAKKHVSMREKQVEKKVHGITFHQHCPKDFLRPCGKAVNDTAGSEKDIQNKLQPFTYEWLNRPGVAASETLDTLKNNIHSINDMKKILKNEDAISNYLNFQQDVIEGTLNE